MQKQHVLAWLKHLNFGYSSIGTCILVRFARMVCISVSMNIHLESFSIGIAIHCCIKLASCTQYITALYSTNAVGSVRLHAFTYIPLYTFCRSHLILRNLRPAGSKEYVIPKGFAFNYITCANYTFEIYGWILFGVATQTVAAFMFIAAGSLPMTQWALAKHKRLRKVCIFLGLHGLFGIQRVFCPMLA